MHKRGSPVPVMTASSSDKHILLRKTCLFSPHIFKFMNVWPACLFPSNCHPDSCFKPHLVTCVLILERNRFFWQWMKITSFSSFYFFIGFDPGKLPINRIGPGSPLRGDEYLLFCNPRKEMDLQEEQWVSRKWVLSAAQCWEQDSLQ